MTVIIVNYESSKIPWILLGLLIVLVVVLVYYYKKLNRENDGQYTIKRMIYKEGGVRDRVRGAALGLGGLLGIRLWPRSETSEDGDEEMQEMHDEEAQVEDGNSQGSDTEGDEEQEEEEEGNNSEASDTCVNVECADAGEEVILIDETEQEEKGEEKKEVEEEEQGKAEASGGTGLLIDLKNFSGSAIWSGEGEVCDVTPL